jgi:aryl-alcohol dehydrogenase-like predicted oxidoreductase
MGTWQTGKAMWVGIDDNESARAIRASLDAGITTFDTAEIYGDGHSEMVLGRALGADRHRAVIATKVFTNHYAYDQVIEACHRSLKHLGTDYIDLYQLHWPPGSFGGQQVPVEEPLQALEELKTQGKIRALGVSNFSRDLLEITLNHCRVDSLQPPYSLFWRQVEERELPYCREHELTVLAYSSMAQGLLTGKFGPEHRFAKGDHRSANKLFASPHYGRVQAALDQLRPLAAANGITLGQLALAWVIHQPGVCAIAGARSAEQATQNAAAAEVKLTSADLSEIDRIGRTVTDHLDADAVMWQW